jgi:Protein of unknown function (DUF4231)
MAENVAPPALDEDGIRRRLYWRVAAKADIATDEDRATFVNAWYTRMTRRGQLGDRFKNGYFVLLALSSLAAASVPALIGAAGSSHTTAGNAMRAIAAVLGVLVAVTTSVLGVVQVGARWRLYRTYSQKLEEAGWAYLSSKKAAGAAYEDFVKQVDDARLAYDRDYLREVAVTSSHSGKEST